MGRRSHEACRRASLRPRGHGHRSPGRRSGRGALAGPIGHRPRSTWAPAPPTRPRCAASSPLAAAAGRSQRLEGANNPACQPALCQSSTPVDHGIRKTRPGPPTVSSDHGKVQTKPGKNSQLKDNIIQSDLVKKVWIIITVRNKKKNEFHIPPQQEETESPCPLHWTLG